VEVENYVSAVNEMASIRFARLAGKYQVETEDGPVNAGFFRDNVMDILEEVTDVVNIAGILFERLVKDANTDHLLLASGGLQLMEDAVNTFIAACVYLDQRLPAAYREEDVLREVSRKEVGLCAG
jgi:hypothetical protein